MWSKLASSGTALQQAHVPRTAIACSGLPARCPLLHASSDPPHPCRARCSRSPAIHNAALQQLGLNAVYVPLLVDDMPAFLATFTGGWGPGDIGLRGGVPRVCGVCLEDVRGDVHACQGRTPVPSLPVHRPGLGPAPQSACLPTRQPLYPPPTHTHLQPCSAPTQTPTGLGSA